MVEIETNYLRIIDVEESNSCQDDDYILIDSEENGVRRISRENLMREVHVVNGSEDLRIP